MFARVNPIRVNRVAPLFARLYSTANSDVVIIGGGPGGYVAAIKAGQLGLKVTCVEKRGALGGTCLNVGCIPSKALLNSSHMFEAAQKEFEHHGVMVNGVSVDLQKMMTQKSTTVTGLTKGIEGLFKKYKVNYVKGSGKITGKNEVTVTNADGTTSKIPTNNIIIATGSEPVALPFLPYDEKRVVSSTGALALESVPKKMVVIGGGVIGLELGSVWRRLGAEVTVIEYFDKIVPSFDDEIIQAFHRSLVKQGMKFKLATKLVKAETSANGVKLTTEPAAGGAQETLEADVVLVSIGRKPYTENLGLQDVGVKVDDKGRVLIDKHFRSNIPNIYAIGDVTTGPMLAHKAEEEGIAAVEIIAGKGGHVNYDAIPSVVYTHPEVASVGKTEQEVKKAGIEYKVGKFPFLANSRARANGDADGLVKIITEAKTDRVLGIHIVGSNAGEQIAEGVLAMEYGASSEDIARTCHAHPTLSEAVKEAALAAHSKPIHF